MTDSKPIALIGAALLFVGVFMPFVSMPIVGSLNYFGNGKGDGVFIIAMAAIAAGLALSGNIRETLWPGLASLAMFAFTFIRFQTTMADARAQLETDLAGNPFRGFADAAVDSVQLQWGWAVLLIGALMVTYAGWAARRGERKGDP